ncbi:hypothetical protein DL762_000334 [Monosporascus cannonballus]|uniref:GP-PDE domain-containing protein n=1 Tax=Monosporascus cannonballus TaxID=155416 RepID=A0ABY0HKX4_9PEZI|nr:hypothetical protein DL762_000334 [Monosporascus cannonballus]
MHNNEQHVMRRIIRCISLRSPDNTECAAAEWMKNKGFETVYDLDIFEGRNTAIVRHDAGISMCAGEQKGGDEPVKTEEDTTPDSDLEFIPLARMPRREHLAPSCAGRCEDEQSITEENITSDSDLEFAPLVRTPKRGQCEDARRRSEGRKSIYRLTKSVSEQQDGRQKRLVKRLVKGRRRANTVPYLHYEHPNFSEDSEPNYDSEVEVEEVEPEELRERHAFLTRLKAEVDLCVVKIKAKMRRISNATQELFTPIDRTREDNTRRHSRKQTPSHCERPGEEGWSPDERFNELVRRKLCAWVNRGGQREFAGRFARDYETREFCFLRMYGVPESRE